MLGIQQRIRPPVHPLGLPSLRIEDTRLPTEASPDSVCAPCRSIIVGFTLAGISQIPAVSAGIVLAGAVNDCHAPPAGWTPPPNPPSTERASRMIQFDNLLDSLPLEFALPAKSVSQNHTSSFRSAANTCVGPFIECPCPSKLRARGQEPSAVDLPNVERLRLLGGVLPALISPSTSDSAHFFPFSILPKSSGNLEMEFPMKIAESISQRGFQVALAILRFAQGKAHCRASWH